MPGRKSLFQRLAPIKSHAVENTAEDILQKRIAQIRDRGRAQASADDSKTAAVGPLASPETEHMEGEAQPIAAARAGSKSADGA